ncbi:MAG: LysM peptidoglycan-binding domain-containing protein [Chlamydiae bacterium]|nr:LysM peptidoglycan-binding domain-containing protein [Chlamydiota bacterium]
MPILLTFFSLLLLLSSCTAPLAVAQQDKQEYTSSLQELRYEVADLKHALHHAQVEIQLLDEQCKEQEKLARLTKSSSHIDQRLLQLENSQKKLSEELKSLSLKVTQVVTEYASKVISLEKALFDQQQVLGQIRDLRSSLLATDSESNGTIYKVKPGDSLEKIAKMHKVTVKALRDTNRLLQDKIFVGQELKIPD